MIIRIDTKAPSTVIASTLKMQGLKQSLFY